jgi:hypothetical protein
MPPSVGRDAIIELEPIENGESTKFILNTNYPNRTMRHVLNFQYSPDHKPIYIPEALLFFASNRQLLSLDRPPKC